MEKMVESVALVLTSDVRICFFDLGFVSAVLSATAVVSADAVAVGVFLSVSDVSDFATLLIVSLPIFCATALKLTIKHINIVARSPFVFKPK